MDLAIEKIVFLVPHLEVLLETFDISAQVLVFVCQLRVEVLLEVQVTLHVIYFSIPKVEFVSLLRVVLFHKGHASAHILRLTILLFYGTLEILHTLL